MKSYQFIILFGASFGILFSGMTLIFLIGSQLNDSVYTSQIYIVSLLLSIYIINIIVALILGNAKIVGVISIVSSAATIILFIPTTPQGLAASAVLMAGGILAIIRKPKQNNPAISK